MKIAGTQFTLKDRAFEIYISGCSIHCKGCHNPELWDFNYGEELTIDYISDLIDKIEDAGKLVKEIRILGGEPLQNNQDELLDLILDLKLFFCGDIKFVLFTGFDLKEVPHWCLDVFDSVKYGRYIEELRVDGQDYASSNQGVWIK